MKTSRQYRQSARELTHGKILTLFLISLVFSVIVGALSFAGPIILGYVSFGMTVTYIAIINEQEPLLDQVLLAGVKEQPVKALILGIVQSLFISLWSLLFIIPGIIKSYSYALSTYILIKEPTIESMDAITKSRQLMNGYKWKLFALDFSYVGWYVLSVFTFGILTIWISAWHQTARTLFFRDVYLVDKAK
jgi:uncharacterized membrane protein